MNAVIANLIFSIHAAALCGCAVWARHASFWEAVGGFCVASVIYTLASFFAGRSGIKKAESLAESEDL